MKYLTIKTVGSAKCQRMMVKGLMVMVLSLPFMSTQSVAQRTQDTICFTYDEGKNSLQVTCPRFSNEREGVCFKIGQNDYSLSLERNIVQKTKIYLPGSDDPQYLGLYGKEYESEHASWFDSSGVMSVDFYYFKDYANFAPGAKMPSKVVVIRKVVSEEPEEVVESATQKAKFPIWMLIVGAVVVAIVLALVFLIKKKGSLRKPKAQKKETPLPKDSSLEIVEEVSSELVRNLDYVRHSPDNYYKIDMSQVFVDTAVHNIYLHHTAVKKMYDFFKHSLESSEQTNETGCYFVGCWEYDGETRQVYNITVEDIVEPGDDLVPGEFSFNFGLKIGVKLFARLSELSKNTNRDFVHTVWMHSHPGLGLFLSSHDLLVQKQLTYSDAPGRLVAFVIDTNTPEWDLAIFTSKTDGGMNNKDDLRKSLFSLEQIYKWSRNARAKNNDEHAVLTEVADKTESMENYYLYPWQTNHQGTKRSFNAYFGGHAISAIEDILYDNAGKQTIGGYVIGKKESKGNFTNMVIDDCVAEWRDGTIAMLIVDDKVKDEDITTKYVGVKPLECVMVFKTDNELLVLVRDSVNDPFPPLSEAAVCPMKLLKAWIRRRRIIK